jgi:hypothetical protein
VGALKHWMVECVLDVCGDLHILSHPTTVIVSVIIVCVHVWEPMNEGVGYGRTREGME